MDIGEIGRVIAAPAGVLDGDQHYIGGGDRRREFAREAQPAARWLACSMASSPASWIGTPVLLIGDAFGVVIDAGHVIAEIGKTGPRYEADIARTDDGNLHDAISLEGAGPLRPFAGNIAGDG